MGINLYFAAKVNADKPYSDNRLNNIEFINECFMLVVFYLFNSMAVMPLTSGQASAVMKNLNGIVVNWVIIALFLSNLIFLAYANYSPISLSFMKWYNIN